MSPQPRVFAPGSAEPADVELVTDEDGFEWKRAGRATETQHNWRRVNLGVMGSLVLWRRLNKRQSLTEVLAMDPGAGVDLARIVGLHGADPVPTVTVEQIRDRFAELGQDDPDVGHGMEDAMLRRALEAIRDGHPNPAALARDVLIVASAKFPRW